MTEKALCLGKCKKVMVEFEPESYEDKQTSRGIKRLARGKCPVCGTKVVVLVKKKVDVVLDGRIPTA